jgi:8-oxo-dGTP pyrophosphatase MutT (NUDIX family)
LTLEPADSRQGFLVCVVFVIERAGEVLLLKRSRSKDHAPGEWETGSGGILSGEMPVAAVVREAKEETGLDVGADQRSRRATERAGAARRSR